MSDQEWEERKAAEPNPEPDSDPSDPHMGPLDNPDDARYLDPIDPRRREIERERGRPFSEADETGD